jgi:hypothetical protein
MSAQFAQCKQSTRDFLLTFQFGISGFSVLEIVDGSIGDVATLLLDNSGRFASYQQSVVLY